MLEEITALCHRKLIGAFIANAHLPVSWQVSPLLAFQQSVAVLITAEESVLVAQVDVSDVVPIDLRFEECEKNRFCKTFPLLPWEHRYFSIRTDKRKKDYQFSPEWLKTTRFASTEAYWRFLVQS